MSVQISSIQTVSWILDCDSITSRYLTPTAYHPRIFLVVVNTSCSQSSRVGGISRKTHKEDTEVVTEVVTEVDTEVVTDSDYVTNAPVQ
jgi:hypothetical protein